MKRTLIITLLLISACLVKAQTTNNMNLNAGIFTNKLEESKKFYVDNLGFGVAFENDFYLLLHTPNKQATISFTHANHHTQQPFFQTEYGGTGMYFTIEIDDVDSLYAQLKDKGLEIKIELRDEPWGDRHFAIEDPNGIGIDLVTYTEPE